MWQRGLNWAAIIMVGIFGLMWVGIVIYADQGSPLWMRIVQVVFGFLLQCWAIQKALRLLGRV
ncbi:hypothetical protein FAF44_43610 [Nonomuraea sp. MG754425]|uniref:hypothetical protein n=1 Tax=Nonomuraea sp. MG754425 TaxID=2570319 RepID=UPI001F1F57B0|nr:hypothetical protein [Nonomuraea sp. MG754425]MCF6475210.1 hypothetical protein [Nonomuraea sp. MG754425]